MLKEQEQGQEFRGGGEGGKGIGGGGGFWQAPLSS